MKRARLDQEEMVDLDNHHLNMERLRLNMDHLPKLPPELLELFSKTHNQPFKSHNIVHNLKKLAVMHLQADILLLAVLLPQIMDLPLAHQAHMVPHFKFQQKCPFPNTHTHTSSKFDRYNNAGKC
jgi:hypothetical protein